MFATFVWKIDLKAQLHEAASASDEDRISISFNIMLSSFTKNLSKLLVSGGRAHTRWRASGNGRTRRPVALKIALQIASVMSAVVITTKPRIERWVA